MASFFSGLLGFLVATNQSSAASNLVQEATGAKIEIVDANDPVEREYQRLLDLDNESQADVDRWILDNDQLAGTGAAAEGGMLRARIEQRFLPVEKGYKAFLDRNPRHVRGLMAYGSFLGDIGREDEAAEQYIKARDIDPKNPAPWNNLANFYGHNGPLTNAFICYEKAIELNPKESVYYQNFATTIYLFRWDATNYFNISQQQVFDKAMALYSKALSLDPENFPLATDLAQTFYGIRPPRVAEAFKAWNEALRLASDDIEREGVQIHLARWHRTAGDGEAARQTLSLVTNQMYQTTKEVILKSLLKAEGTNVSATVVAPK